LLPAIVFRKEMTKLDVQHFKRLLKVFGPQMAEG